MNDLVLGGLSLCLDRVIRSSGAAAEPPPAFGDVFVIGGEAPGDIVGGEAGEEIERE